MIDMFGIELNEDDEVIYTNSSKGATQLKRGIILSIDGGHAEVKSIETGRVQHSMKNSSEMAAVAPYRETNPELFI